MTLLEHCPPYVCGLFASIEQTREAYTCRVHRLNVAFLNLCLGNIISQNEFDKEHMDLDCVMAKESPTNGAIAT